MEMKPNPLTAEEVKAFLLRLDSPLKLEQNADREIEFDDARRTAVHMIKSWLGILHTLLTGPKEKETV